MFRPVPMYIGLRYAKASKASYFVAFINLFSVVGIALGLMSLIIVLAVMNGFEGQLKLRILGLVPQVVVATNQSDSDMIGRLQAIPQVQATSQFIEAEGVAQSPSALQGVMIQGIEPELMTRYSILAEHMLTGQIDQLEEGSFRVVIGRALSIKLNLHVGDKTRLYASGASIFSPMGRLPSQRLFTVSGIYELGSELDDRVVLVNVHDSARLLRKSTEQISQTRLFLYDAFDYLHVQEAVKALGLSSQDWRERQGPLFDAVKMEKNMMSLMLMLIIAVAAFNIVSALVMVVSEKQGDIGILLTQGMSKMQVMSIFLFNGTFNGLKGTAWGTVLGLLLVWGLNDIVRLLNLPLPISPNGQLLPVALEWEQVGLLVLFSLILCFLASLYPAYRAVKVDPAVALNHE